MSDENKNANQAGVLNFNINFDTTPVYFTDLIQMTVNENGIILDFGQRFLNTNQVKIVTRVGMSREHAKQFISKFSQLVAMTEGQLQTISKKKN